ncbi:amidohydrolase [Cupriavidus necator]
MAAVRSTAPCSTTRFALAGLALAAGLLCNTTQAQAQATPADPLHTQIETRAKAVEKQLIAWRRDIHQHPELGNYETRTAKLVADHLRKLGMEVKTGVAKTGVVGVLKGGKPGPVVALRADMDALPVKERVDVPFASKAKGQYLGKEVDVMHACGHDTHVAILMATAEVLAGMKDQLPGTVKFIFQPAEESPADFEPNGSNTWGAKQMVSEGVLDNPRVDAIFGLHVTSGIESGKLGWRSGASMAAADQFWIDVKGRQTHGARPWGGIDPIVVASQIVMGLQTIQSRQVNAMLEPSVITVGTIHGGNRMNIVPETVEMMGTVRTYDEGMKKDIHARMKRTTEAIASSAGAEANFRVVELYNATINQPALTEKMAPTLQRVAGDGNWMITPKATASEDFSFYQEKVPGLFFNLGVTPRGQDVNKAPSNHSPEFYVDEPALINGVRALSNLTVDYMVMAQR